MIRCEEAPLDSSGNLFRDKRSAFLFTDGLDDVPAGKGIGEERTAPLERCLFPSTSFSIAG
jgi:hypothetical protein